MSGEGMRIRGSKPRFGSADNPKFSSGNNAWEFIYPFFTRARVGRVEHDRLRLP
jgi:hypothetical protein